MYKVDIASKSLTKLTPKWFSELNLKERFDIQEWVAKEPSILGEELLIIAKEYELPSRIRLDLLAIDQIGNLVIIELKRDNSGSETEWQAIKYASYCSTMPPERIISIFASYKNIETTEAKDIMDAFLLSDAETINSTQRIILVAKEFHSDVASAVLWLRDFEIDIKCVRLRPYLDSDGDLFITPDIIIPLPEAKDYIQGKEARQRESKTFHSTRSLFSLEESNHDRNTLAQLIGESLSRESDLTPRLIAFFKIISKENRMYTREEIKNQLFEAGIGTNIGQTGRYLSNISQFITKPSNPHLRQILKYDSAGGSGEIKETYQIKDEYFSLVNDIVITL